MWAPEATATKPRRVMARAVVRMVVKDSEEMSREEKQERYSVERGVCLGEE